MQDDEDGKDEAKAVDEDDDDAHLFLRYVGIRLLFNFNKLAASC